MTDEGVQAFLHAEEQANHLVDELERLRSETESNATASESLEQAGKQVVALAEELAGLSGRIGELVATLRSIGTPETRQAHEEVLTQLSALREDVAKANDSLASALVGAKDHNRVLVRGLRMTVLGASVVLVIVVVAGVLVTVIAR